VERSWARARLLADLANREEIGTAELVAQAQAGDRLAFADLYIRYFDSILRYAETCLKSREDAEDIAQRVVVRVIEALPSYKPERQEFSAWLFAIVRNQTIDHIRRNDRVQPEAPERIDRRQEEGPERATSRDHAWHFDEQISPLVNLLPKRQRDVLALRYLFDFSQAEVANTLGCSIDCVRQAQHRALKFLASRLEPLQRKAIATSLQDV
jgi:RNA polymerase sigma-70 factor (ECF subfamily)